MLRPVKKKTWVWKESINTWLPSICSSCSLDLIHSFLERQTVSRKNAKYKNSGGQNPLEESESGGNISAKRHNGNLEPMPMDLVRLSYSIIWITDNWSSIPSGDEQEDYLPSWIVSRSSSAFRSLKHFTSNPSSENLVIHWVLAHELFKVVMYSSFPEESIRVFMT